MSVFSLEGRVKVRFNCYISTVARLAEPTQKCLSRETAASEVEISKQIANQILEEISEKCIKSGIAKNCKDN